MFGKKQAQINVLTDEVRCLKAALQIMGRILEDEQEAHAHASNKAYDLSLEVEDLRDKLSTTSLNLFQADLDIDKVREALAEAHIREEEVSSALTMAENTINDLTSELRLLRLREAFAQ